MADGGPGSDQAALNEVDPRNIQPLVGLSFTGEFA